MIKTLNHALAAIRVTFDELHDHYYVAPWHKERGDN